MWNQAARLFLVPQAVADARLDPPRTAAALLGAGARYTAKFTEAAGLKPGNEVRVAGVKVGEVDDVTLDGDRVNVTFRVENTWIGDQTQATIQIKTILGQKYLSLNPRCVFASSTWSAA